MQASDEGGRRTDYFMKFLKSTFSYSSLINVLSATYFVNSASILPILLAALAIDTGLILLLQTIDLKNLKLC